MWPQGAYGQQQYPQQPYQYIQHPQGPYNNPQPMNNNKIPTEVIDWDGVSSIDPDLIRMTGDLTQLQPFISKFVGANLSAYESQVLSHPLSVRLCSILQVSLQYMSDVQKELQAKIEARERQIAKQQYEYKKLASTYAKADELLKRQMKPSERCPICLKRFKNFDFLDQHVERRHPEHVDEWLSIRNKRPLQKQNQNDINAIMERIEALQKSIRKDREKQKHHSRRRKSENDENMQTLHQELLDQQDQLMATEAMQDELLMTKRDDMKSELDTAVEELNASWIAWSNNTKKNNNQKNKDKKISKEEDELNNMYNNDNKMENKFDQIEDQLELDGHFGNCQSIDEDPLKDQNFDVKPMNNFQFQMLQNSQVPNQQQPIQTPQTEKESKPKKEKTKSNKSAKKSKHSLFGRKKSKHNLNSEDNSNNKDISNDQPAYSNVNEFEAPRNFENNTPKVKKSKPEIIRYKSKMPPKKKVLPDDVKELIAKARTIVVRKFNPTYDDATVNHVMKSIEKKMNGFKKQYANNNETPDQVNESLRLNFDGEKNDYEAIRRKVMLKIDNEVPVKHCTLFDSSFSESSALSSAQGQKQEQTNQVHINQRQFPQQNISQSSISSKNKKMNANNNNLDDIPKPNNSQFNTSYSNYVSTSISTTYSMAKTPHEEGNTVRKRKRKPKPVKSSYSYITSNSNAPDGENQSQSKSNENANPPPSNTKKLHFIKPKQQIQCKKHFKSAGHSVRSPYPMLSGTPVSSTKENINNTNEDVNNSNNISNNNNNYNFKSNNLNYNNNDNNYNYANYNNNNNNNNNSNSTSNNNEYGINYNDNNNDFGINQNFVNYANNVNNNNNINNNNDEIYPPPNDAVFYQNAIQEEEYIYEEEEEEEETPEVPNNNITNNNTNSVDQNVAFEEEEQFNDTNNYEQVEIQAADPVTNEIEQQLISTEVPKNNDDDSFSLTKSLNNQDIEPPNFIKRAKNEITSSTDVMYDPPPPSPLPNLTQSPQQQNNLADSLDQSDQIQLQPQPQPQVQVQIQRPQSNQPPIQQNANDDQYEYSEYEYYTDETASKSDGEIASNQKQSEQINQLKKEGQLIQQEEAELNEQIQQQQEQEKSDLEPFTISSQDQPIVPPSAAATQSTSFNVTVDVNNNNSEIVVNQNPIPTPNPNPNTSNNYSKSDYYSSSGTNLFYKFDSSTTILKSKSNDISNQNEIEQENNKYPNDDEPVKQTVYQTNQNNVGSMDNIVSFDEVKSIESIENIQKSPSRSKSAAPSAENSEFNFDSLINKSKGGDSFMSESTKSNLTNSRKFSQSKQASQIPPQSIDPSSYNVSTPATTSSGNLPQTKNDSFIARQRNILASKYGNVPPPSTATTNTNSNTTTNANTNTNIMAKVSINPQNDADEGEEYEEEEEEEEEEYEEYEFENDNNNNNADLKQTNSFIGNGTDEKPPSAAAPAVKKFNVIDIFKQSSNSSFVKPPKNNSKTFTGSKLQKTFAGSSSAAGEDDDEFDYSRGPPMNNNGTFNDEDFESESNFNRNVSTGKDSMSKYVDDSEGPPLLSRKKNQDSIISNDDFNL